VHLATSQSVVNNKEVAKVLGVDRRNIKKTSKRRLLLDTSGFIFQTNYKRAKSPNSLFEHFRQLVINWWTIETIISLDHKDIVKLKTSMT